MLKKFPATDFAFCHNLITAFRGAFGLPINTITEHTSISLHDSLHLEELLELAESSNICDQLDALGDLVYVIFGRIVESGIKDHHTAVKLFPEYISWLSYINAVADRLVEKHFQACNQIVGYEIYPLDKAPELFMIVFQAIHDSNMTKLCKAEEVEATQKYYLDKKIKTTAVLTRVGLHAIKVVEDNSGQTLPFGKVLKNINYKPVKIYEVLEAYCSEIESPRQIK